MDWQTAAAIVASIGAIVISLYTAKSAVSKSDIETMQRIIVELRIELERYKAKYECLQRDYERALKMYQRIAAFVRKLGFNPEDLDGDPEPPND